jgi:protein-tyrosine kinase
MGKIYDALEKTGKAKDMKVASTRRTRPARGNKAKPPIRVLNAEPGAFKKTAHAGQIDPRLVTYHDPASVESEIFKILRTNILFPKTGEPPVTIMVTSAIPGDGKSFVAANLAISIAQGVEDHVLLMDCDMRRSSIHRSFGFGENVPGLSEYLSQKVPLSSLLRKTVVDKLTILPGGNTPSNPSELLSSLAMRHLLEQAKNRYSDRYVIVDSPPPQLTAETAALANYIDGIILVVKYGSTPKALIEDLLEKVGREKVIGVVMNGYRVPTTERYGYGKYKKYGKY